MQGATGGRGGPQRLPRRQHRPRDIQPGYHVLCGHWPVSPCTFTRLQAYCCRYHIATSLANTRAACVHHMSAPATTCSPALFVGRIVPMLSVRSQATVLAPLGPLIMHPSWAKYTVLRLAHRPHFLEPACNADSSAFAGNLNFGVVVLPSQHISRLIATTMLANAGR